jgi:hypothetical protein
MSTEDKMLRPKHDLLVRDPITKEFLSKDGEVKPVAGSAAGKYWARRIKNGSVEIVEPGKADESPNDQNGVDGESDIKRSKRKKEVIGNDNKV